MTAGAGTRADAARRLATLPAVSAPELVEVCARQADELAAQAEAAQHAVDALLSQLDGGRLELAAGSACWLGATLRVLAGSLGELHTVLDEATQLARADQSAPADRPRVPSPRQPEPARGPDQVVAGAVEALYRLRHRLGPDVLRSLAGIWTCASAACYGEPAEEFWTDATRFAAHDVAGCQDEEGDDRWTRR